MKFDVNEEAWPNADLVIRASYEGALIDGLPANRVKACDGREIQQMKDLQLYSWVKETDIPPNKSILLTGWARRMKGSEVRSRCVLKDFATTVRDDVFAPTPSPLSVRGLLLYAAWFNLRVETGDLVCAFMQADSSCEMFARPPKGQERDGWIWRLHGAKNGMRTASRDFTEFLAGILTEHMGCLFVRVERSTGDTTRGPSYLWQASDASKILEADHEVGRDQERRSSRLPHTCNLPGIRVPKCTRR